MRIRDMFVPDPKHVLLDCDLSGADAQVVAWTASDDNLKTAFRAGVNIHTHNARMLFGAERIPWSLSETNPKLYKLIKIAVHMTNYNGSAKTLSGATKWPMSQCVAFQQEWFQLHPAIKSWHRRIQHALDTRRSVSNPFGFRIVYFDRDNFSEALAWEPQSVVAITCDRGARRVQRNLPWVDIMLQNHDSLVMQVPFHRYDQRYLIKEQLENPVPYPDPLVIPWGLKSSPKSWGAVKPDTWITERQQCPTQLH
jgi:DNA polymerase-1